VAKESRIQLRYEQAFDSLGMTGYRYGVLLVVIMVSLVFQLAAPEADWARLVTIVLQGLTLLMALVASRVHPWVLRIALVGVSVSIIGTAAALIGFGHLGPTGARLLTALLVALAPVSIVRGVIIDVQKHGVTLHTMFGVLCIYLLLGILFAFLYGAVGALGSEPFFKQHASETTKNFLYFSFVTITTVGYGDLTAGTYFGRSIAIAEALAGQIYLVTVVAAIVGGLGANRRASGS
jgi:hypothetical protein